MTKVGNQTNSLDPQLVNCRLFVGNLNTHVVTKEELGKVFLRYGSVIGISMHKGYAFVQFTDTWDARNAVMGEDGRNLAGQVLDVNMVSEPKPHQITRKRQVTGSSDNRKPIKRAKASKNAKSKEKSSVVCQQFLYNNPDILICGNCKELFQGIQTFFEHKKQSCKLRFSCQCHKDAPTIPICTRCETKFPSWWDLVQHTEMEHSITIYQKHDDDVITNPLTSELSDATQEESVNSWESNNGDGDTSWLINMDCNQDIIEQEKEKDDLTIVSKAEKSVGTDDLTPTLENTS